MSAKLTLIDGLFFLYLLIFYVPLYTPSPGVSRVLLTSHLILHILTTGQKDFSLAMQIFY